MLLDTDNSSALVAAPETGQRLAARHICLCVAACVALDFGIDAATLFAAKRTAPRIAHARQIAMYLAHVGFGLPFDVIGRHFGRDRTTVAHACRVIEDMRDDRWLDCRINALEQVSRGAVTATQDPR